MLSQCRRPVRLAAAIAALLVPASAIQAQSPFALDISVRYFAEHGLPGPASLAYNFATQTIYASSLNTAALVDLFRVLPDGTVETYTQPVADPDVLVLDSAGMVYIGAFGGKITQIDPTTGVQIQWKKDSKLGNVDGMAFDLSGNLLASAIDTHKIYRIDFVTRALTLFADLTALNNNGYGSIALAPDGTVFIASPNDGNLLKLAPDGTLLDPQFATGFLHMGQLAVADGFIYASDTGARTVRKIDLTTGQNDLWIRNVPDHSGGIVHLGSGEFYCSWQSLDNLDGGVYRVSNMHTTLESPPQLGHPLHLDLDSIADAGRLSMTFYSLVPGTTPLANGRFLPVALQPGSYVKFTGRLDANGHKDWDFQIPFDPALANLTIYTTWLTFAPGGVMGIADVESFVILP